MGRRGVGRNIAAATVACEFGKVSFYSEKQCLRPCVIGMLLASLHVHVMVREGKMANCVEGVL
eukprot:2745949-Amphidinium_carterae.1